MSKKSTFLDVYQFESYTNGFLDLEFLNFDTQHDFFSSIEAKIIIFLPKKVAIFIFCLSFNFQGGSTSKFDK